MYFMLKYDQMSFHSPLSRCVIPDALRHEWIAIAKAYFSFRPLHDA